MSEEVEVLKRMLERERMARKETEKILEQKSFELESINGVLEELVEIRTKESDLLAKFPSHDPSPVMRIKSDGIIDYANASSLKLLSFWNSKVGEMCPNYIFLVLQECLNKNSDIELEIKNEIDARIYSFIFSPVEGFNYVFAYGRDITYLKKIQVELNENINLYKQLVEESSDIIHRTHLNGRFSYVNPVANIILGYTEEELIGKSYLSLIRDDYKEKANLFYKNQIENQIIETYFEFPILTKLGEVIWIGQNSKLIYNGEALIGFHSIARNIDERKRTQIELENTSNRLKTLIANLQTGVLMENEYRKIVLTNSNFCNYFNIPLDPSVMVGFDCSNSAEQSKILFKDPDLFVSRIDQILLEKKLVTGEELELLSGKILERNYIPIFNDDLYMGHLWEYIDITERKREDKKLIKQKEFYESILNNIPTDIAVFDKDHRYLFLNPQAIKDPDLRKWIIDKDDYEYMEYRGKSSLLADERRKTFNSVLQSKQTVRWEEKLTELNGETIYRMRYMCPVIDHNNEVTNIIGYGLDITNERIIEDELRINENNLRVINQISHELIINQDFDKSIYKSFSYLIQALGCENINIYQHKIDVGSNRTEINHRYGISYENKEFILNNRDFQNIDLNLALLEGDKEKLSSGKYLEIDLTLTDEYSKKVLYNDGSKFIFIFPVMVLNELWGSIVYEYKFEMKYSDEKNIDILYNFSNAFGGAIHRKETEDKLKAIVTSLDDIVLQISRDYVYENIWISDNSKLKFPKEKYLNKALSEVVDSSLVQIFEKAIDEVLVTKGVRTFIYQSPDLLTYYRCKICYLNRDSVSALVEDITEQKLGEIELVNARERAEHSVIAKEQFLANMSHEIRTPMNAIVGMCKLLDKTPLNNKQSSYLNAINVSSKNLLMIINDILDFSKIESTKLVFEKIGFKLVDVISEVIKTSSYKILEKNLSLTYEIDKSISPILIGDPLRLNQILLNLVNNAIKFTKEGRIIINCKLESKGIDKNKIIFSVKDTGIGISQNKLDTIFESFTQEDETITRQYGGTGLGLSICKELVELQGGNISVKSEKGIGTIFSFNLEYPIGNELNLPESSHKEMTEVDLTNTSVLLVEDNEINTFLAQTILENKKMIVDVAENGLIAIEKIKNKKYDIILMDMQMPVMGGVEASKIIRHELLLDIPIIALTANAIKGDDQICIDAGMNDYVSKPFEEEELIRKISVLLNKKRNENFVETKIELLPMELFSLEKLQEMSRGNNSFVTKMVKLFIDNTPNSVAKIRVHYENEEFDKLRAIAHSIKPSIDVLSIHEISNEIRAIETFSPEHTSYIELGLLITKVELIIAKVIEDLNVE